MTVILTADDELVLELLAELLTLLELELLLALEMLLELLLTLLELELLELTELILLLEDTPTLPLDEAPPPPQACNEIPSKMNNQWEFE